MQKFVRSQGISLIIISSQSKHISRKNIISTHMPAMQQCLVLSPVCFAGTKRTTGVVLVYLDNNRQIIDITVTTHTVQLRREIQSTRILCRCNHLLDKLLTIGCIRIGRCRPLNGDRLEYTIYHLWEIGIYRHLSIRYG